MSTFCKYDVFISYSRKDYVDEYKNIIPNNEISKIKEALDINGITYWIDEEGIYHGQNFTEIIVENIEASRIFIFLSTINSNASKWTSKEIATADEFGKHIIPVRIDKTPYNRNVMFRIADLDFIEYYQIGRNAGIKELVSSINKALGEIKRQEEIEKEKKRKAEIEEKKEEIKAEIKLLEDNLYNQLLQENLLITQIAEKKNLIEDNRIICPICNTKAYYSDKFCDNCGWTFNKLEKLLSGDERNEERKRINTVKAHWIKKEKLITNQRESDSLIDKISELEKVCTQTEKENKILKDKLWKSQNSIDSLGKELELLRTNILNITKELSAVNTKNTDLKQTYATIKIENDRLKQFLQEKEELQQTLENRIHQLEEKDKSNEKQTQEIGVVRTLQNALKVATGHYEKTKQNVTTAGVPGTKYAWQTPEFNRIIEEDRNKENDRVRRTNLKRKPKQNITTSGDSGTRYAWQTPEFMKIVSKDREKERKRGQI